MAILNYKKIGEGEPLIILHGLYGSSDNWVSMARLLMHDFAVYLLDMRNHGASPHCNEHDYDHMVDDLNDFMNQNQLYSAILLGHSMGGKVAMFFAAAFPERVKKMIVVDISPRTYKFTTGDMQFNEHLNILNALNNLNTNDLKSREEAAEMLGKDIHSQRVLQFLLKNLKRDKNKVFYWKMNIPVLLNNIYKIMGGLEGLQHDLSLFKKPVLFIRGANSYYIKDIDIELIGNLFRGAQIVTIEGAGHWVHAEKPDEFVRLVKSFVLS